MFERKSLQLELKAGRRGEVEGYASRFGELDQGGDVVARGAYADSLRARMPKMLWQHDPNEPIGVWDQASEDDTGLYVKGRVMDTITKGRDVLEMLRSGVIDGMSIGYRADRASKGVNGERVLERLSLFEVSMVTFPMLESARVDMVKASSMTQREFEGILTQDAGLSRSVARSLMSGGLDAVKAMRDAGDGEGLAEALRSLIK